ncbi:YybH family protein [[Pasteurella] aerogenes]|nr:nuclear transport factor 2 family protein [[Pasteurella] aerogenes]MCU9997794.1 nuclear transport factor 2 family protein [[Pasteurella] aerogenes]MDY2797336.1 nuclear transport factor 2 family protein [[Pasteurella] aerogenes]MDY4478784.1 nuclear transport factor 2 family protein [[Pasteurella] aerogenes]UWZ92459.1 nuclear transport factor 2 family protein [[Pasteurella] aerogenes]
MKKQIVKKILPVIALFSVAACSSQTSTQNASALNQPAAKQAVEQVMQRYQQAMRNADLNGIASTLDDNAVITFQGKLTTRGKADILKGYQATFNAMDFSNIEYLIDEINVDQHLAVVSTYHEVGSFVTNKKSHKKILDHNRELFVLKNENGQWLISRYMYNQTPEQAK